MIEGAVERKVRGRGAAGERSAGRKHDAEGGQQALEF